MRVLALRADASGCAFYRVQEPARVVAAQYGVDIRVDNNAKVQAEQDPDSGIVHVTEVQEDVDLIIVQRPLDNAFVSMLRQARKQGIATIVEIDDDFETIHPRNAAYRQVQPQYTPWANRVWLKIAAFEADLVTVSTRALGKYAAENFEVLPNYMPESVLSLRPSLDAENRNLGWSGTVSTHPGDLEVTGGGVGRALKKSNTRFFNVGDGYGVTDALQLPDFPLVSNWVPLKKYHQAIIDNMNVGIVPLEISHFNQAKSALKGLEMAALGIPFAASPTDEYISLAQEGVGMLASTPEDWYKHTYKWLTNDRKRYADGQRYRKIVAEHHTYEGNAHKWLRAWERAVYLSK